MSIITTPLPDCIIAGGKGYRLNTDFRIWIEFERVMQDRSLSPSVKISKIYDLCFQEPPPYGAALDGVMEFYRAGAPEGKGGGKAVVSFEQDAQYIYAAFYAQYGIDLCSEQLHWYKFRALFAGLKEDNLIVRIMQVRGADLSEIKDKRQKAFYRKLKRTYRLKRDMPDAAQALEGLFSGGE